MTNQEIDKRLMPVHTLLTHAMMKEDKPTKHRGHNEPPKYSSELLAKETWELIDEAEELLNNLRNDLHTSDS